MDTSKATGNDAGHRRQEKAAPVQQSSEMDDGAKCKEPSFQGNPNTADIGSAPRANGAAKEKLEIGSLRGVEKADASYLRYLMSNVHDEIGEQMRREPSQCAVFGSSIDAKVQTLPKLHMPTSRRPCRGSNAAPSPSSVPVPRKRGESLQSNSISSGGRCIRQSLGPSSAPSTESKGTAQMKPRRSRCQSSSSANIGPEHSSRPDQAREGKQAQARSSISTPGAFVVDHESNIIEQRTIGCKGSASVAPQTLIDRDIEALSSTAAPQSLATGGAVEKSDKSLSVSVQGRTTPDGEVSAMNSEADETSFSMYSGSSFHRKLIAATLLISIIVVAVTVPIVLSSSTQPDQGRGANEPQDEREPDPSDSTDEFLAMKELLAAFSGWEGLDDVESPQHAALRWLVYDDEYPLVAIIDELAIHTLGQRFVLAVFYYAMAGDQWLASERWLSRSDVCTWAFILCNDASSVITIDAHENFLEGTLPNEIGFLSSIQTLSLYGNDIAGTLPASLFKLPTLEVLFLSSCMLEGKLSSDIGKLVSLNKLSMYDNALSSQLPSEIGKLSHLIYLDLDGNDLEGSIPTSLANLTKLEVLHLGGNKFIGNIPSQLDNLEKLQELWLHDNKLSGSIPVFEGLVNLQRLRLDGQQLSGSLPDFTNLVNLVELSLESNDIGGTIPASLGKLTLLKELSLNKNWLSGGVPVELGSLVSLTFLDVGHNPYMNGTVPQELCELNLEHFVTDCNIRCSCCCNSFCNCCDYCKV